MINNSSANPAILSEGLEDKISEVSVKANKIGRLCQIMWDSVYSDKVLACVRETIANALDEHDKYSVNKPVHITLEKENGSINFKCRDFAKGLDERGMRDVFAMLLESTKSGDNSQTGGFGVGAKAPLAVVNSFTVISYFGGKATTYSIFKTMDDDGFKANIVEIYSEDSNETGIEVIVPVEKSLESEFREKISSVVENCRQGTEITFEKVKPRKPSATLKVGEATLESGKRGNAPYRFSGGIRMGSIVYPFPSFWKFDSGRFSDEILIIDVPVGTFDLPISREEISDVPASRRKAEELKEKINEARDATLQKEKVSVTKFHSYSFELGVFKYAIGSFDSKVKSTHFVHSNDAKKNCLVNIPSNQSTQRWLDRLKNISPKLDSNYNYFHTVNWPTETDATELFDDLDKFIDIKKLGISKLERNATANSSSRSHKTYCFSSKKGGFYARIEKDTHSISDYVDCIPDRKLADCESMVQLKEHCYTVGSAIEETNLVYVCKTAGEELSATGKCWKWDDPIILKHRSRIDAIEKEKSTKRESVQEIIRNKNFFSKRTIAIIEKNNDNRHLKKLNKLFKELTAPSTLTGRFLSELHLASAYSMKREDVRAIMRKIA